MVLETDPSYAVADTTVLSYFTLRSELGREYQQLIGDRIIALSYFVRAELDGRNWGESRRARLATLYQVCVNLDPGPATRTWFNRAKRKRGELGPRASNVGENDLWIVAHAAEYGATYVSHDRQACEVARALGVEVLTALQDD